MDIWRPGLERIGAWAHDLLVQAKGLSRVLLGLLVSGTGQMQIAVLK
jgi:hypothetical protein